MGRRRTNNLGLPAYVYIRHGAYYYEKHKPPIHLGRVEDGMSGMFRALSKCMEKPINLTTIGQVLDRYMLEVATQKAPTTYRKSLSYAKTIRSVFGHMRLEDLTPQDIYRFLDLRKDASTASANKEKALLSHVYTMAIQWGLINKNPCREVKSLKMTRREYLPTYADIVKFCRVSPPLVRYAVDFAYVTGLRRGDILNLKRSDIVNNTISIRESKTGKLIPRVITPKLQRIINRILRLQKNIKSMYLFCTRRGTKYSDDGFSSIWQRAMKKAVDKGVLKQSFQFKDMRARAASDLPLDHAVELLGHSSMQTTIRHYRRAQKPVKPVR